MGWVPVKLQWGRSFSERRTPPTAVALLLTTDELQWGRSFSERRTQTRKNRPSLGMVLQWGRSFSERRTCECDDDGNCPGCRFNGAALFQSGERYACGGEP